MHWRALLKLGRNQKDLAQRIYYGAQDWTRTSMPFRAPPPQGGASTNFATWAGGAADKGS